jgi:dolichyl-phosphate-mannose-protein mannosyltransferase
MLRIMATYSETGITFDEPGHMACGLQFLAQHVYRYETQHPPLARMASALGPFLDGARPMGNANQDFEGAAILYRNTHVLRTLILMRLGVLPFFGLAGLVVYFWTRRYIGTLTAVIATGLFTLLPPVLAHAGVATTDMALTAGLGAAFYALIRWAETPDIRRSVILGVATGLMVLTKFTALVYLPAAALLALASYVSVQRPAFHHLLTLIQQRAASFVLAVATGALVIWAGYLFSFGPVPGWHISLPAPEVFDGVRSALHHNSIGHPAYLLGRVSISGW